MKKDLTFALKYCFFTRVTAVGLPLTLLEVETFDGHRLATVPGLVNNGPTASLAEDVRFLLRVLQLGPL